MTGTLDRTHVVFAVVAASTLLVARLARLGKRDFLALAGLWALTAAILRVIGPLASLGEYDDYALYLGATGQSVGSPIRPFYDWLLAGNPDILLAFPVHAVTAAFLPSLAYLVARRAGALPRVGIHAGLLVAASASTLVYGAGLNEFVPFAVAVGLTALLVDGATEETSLFGLATRCVAAFAAGIWTLAAATLRAEGYFLLVLVPIALFSETRKRHRGFVLAVVGAWLAPLVFGSGLLAAERLDFVARVAGYAPRIGQWLPVGVCVVLAGAALQKSERLLRLRSSPGVRRLTIGVAMVIALPKLLGGLLTNGLVAWLAGTYRYERAQKVPMATRLVFALYLVLYFGLGDMLRHQLVLLPFAVPFGLMGLSQLATTRPVLARRCLQSGVACLLLGTVITVPVFMLAPKQAEFEALRQADSSANTVWYLPYWGSGVGPEQPLLAVLDPAWNVVELTPPRACPRELFRALALLHAQCVENPEQLARCERAIAASRGDWVVAAAKASLVVNAAHIRLPNPTIPARAISSHAPQSGDAQWLFTPFWARSTAYARLTQGFPAMSFPDFDLSAPASLVLRMVVDPRTTGRSLLHVEVRSPEEGDAACREIARRPEGAVLFRWVEALFHPAAHGAEGQ